MQTIKSIVLLIFLFFILGCGHYENQEYFIHGQVMDKKYIPAHSYTYSTIEIGADGNPSVGSTTDYYTDQFIVVLKHDKGEAEETTEKFFVEMKDYYTCDIGKRVALRQTRLIWIPDKKKGN